VDILFKELLIRVTNFFRDPKAFEILKKKVLPDLFKQASSDQLLRVWVPACSTGEEPYSLAIEFYEYMNEHKTGTKIQIFATDIDNEAIEIARSGLYPDSISVDVSQGRLKRFFTKEGTSFRINKKIREMVVFATQNLLKDPPFSKIDLISCRNLLIYLGARLQKQLIPLFHYALKPEGILFLGSSESIGIFSDIFSVYNSKWKIFKPKGLSHLDLRAMDFPLAQRVHEHAPGIEKLPEAVKKGGIPLDVLTGKMLLEHYAPACVVVNENGDILYIHGRTGDYLEPSQGNARMNIYEMAREGLRIELKTGIRRVITKKEDVVVEGLKVRSNSDIHLVNLTIKHISERDYLSELIMIVFEDVTAPLKKKSGKKLSRKEEKGSKRVSDLEFELKSTREQLQTTIEELEASNEELQSTNEELQSANEELQSTNEELETSKEELQSLNEELMTVNAESQGKIEELTQLNNDINNLLSGTEIATVFLDTEMKIKRYTPESNRIINLIQSDVGRHVNDISSALQYEDLVEDAEEVLKTLTPKEMELREKSGLWFLTRIIPYRTVDNVIDGIVITFTDISTQKHLQNELTDAREYAENIVETIREPLIILDADMLVISANKAFYDTFKVMKKETENRFIYDLGNRQWNIPKLRELLEEILTEKSIFQGFMVEHDFPSIGKKKMVLNARKIVQKGKGKDLILLAIEDITEKTEQ
jgi:two-component system CheB/CheR fusion protein